MVQHIVCESVLVLLNIWMVLISYLGLEMGILTDISWCLSVRPGKHSNSGRPGMGLDSFFSNSNSLLTSNPSINAICER